MKPQHHPQPTPQPPSNHPAAEQLSSDQQLTPQTGASMLDSPALMHSTAKPLRQDVIKRLQHAHGNAYVQRVVSGSNAHAPNRKAAIQRDDDAVATATPTATTQPQSADGSLELKVPIKQPAPIQVPPEDVPGYGPGDYPTQDNPSVVMAKHLDSAVIQRDGPTPGVDIQAQQYPWVLQLSFMYRDLNIAEFRKLHLELGHEPTIQFAIDPSGQLSTQMALGLVNFHWMPPWNAEIETQIQPFANFTLLPKLASSYGSSLQAEQHIIPSVGVTLGVSGTWTPPQGGQPGKFEWGSSVGVVLHIDKLFK